MAGEIILIIEDDPTMRRGLTDNFAFAGYTVRTAADGRAGLREAQRADVDLILLDIMLPGVNGYEICRRVRADGLDMPILMLTAKGQESDIVMGLNLGADDYITKPFSINELLARVQAFIRRRRRLDATVVRFGPYELNHESRILSRDGEQIALTPKEFGLLGLLSGRPGRAFTRDEILRRVWGHDVFVTHRSVDRCVNTLRAKIEPDLRRPIYIQTVREIGYRFETGD
jgi:DNA-binding response OmpR family regulator